MKRIFFFAISLIFLLPLSAFAQDLDITQQADSAYMADDFSRAVALYEQALEEEGSSSVLWYNLGNAYYRLDRLGDAILCYHRALRLDPSNADARTNLRFVNSRIADRPSDNRSMIEMLTDRIVNAATPNAWAVTALVLFIVLIGAAALYIFASGVAVRKWSFFGGIILAVLVILTLFIAREAASRATSDSGAIIMEPAVQLSTSPRVPKDRSEEAFRLHEGTMVEVLDSVATPADTLNPLWYEVIVDGTHRAWLPARSVRRI